MVSLRNNLHEVSKAIFWEKMRQYFKMSPAEIFAQHAKQFQTAIKKGDKIVSKLLTLVEFVTAR